MAKVTLLIACLAVLTVATMIRQSHQPVTKPDNNGSEKLRFKSSVVFDGNSDDGTRFSDEVYEVSDCTKIYKKLTLFRTPPMANNELSSQIQSAAFVADRSPEFDRDHHQIGERALLSFTPDSKSEGYSMLIWTENSELYWVRGASSHHVLEFEKWLRDPNPSKDQRPPEDGGNQEMTFDLLRDFDGKTNEGIKFSEKQFKSTECITVRARTEYYESPSVAHDEFQKTLKGAAVILERGPMPEAQSREERAVAMFAPDPASEYQPQAVVISTNGSEIHVIKAPSLRHVKEFEKREQQK